MSLKLGRNGYISNEEYHGDNTHQSSSGLKLLLADEYEFRRKHIFGHWEDEDNAAFAFGTYIHTLILEPHLIQSTTAIYTGKVRRGKEYEEFKAKNVGKVIVTSAECTTAYKMLANFNRMPISKSLILRGRSEETFCANIKGVPLKVRFDSIGAGFGLDVKTTSSPIDARNMMQTIERYDYALSAALYQDVANESGETVKDFYFLFANKKSCELVLIKAGPDIIEKGRKQYLEALEKYNKLKNAGFFDSIVPVLEVVETSEVKNDTSNVESIEPNKNVAKA